ncbi:cell wall hydrolase [Erythrobacter sp. F6033]|uniref:cell wall hydrolase n=1 Tax=Erythrobacter sp. F6033 TaxID=2926401 RepID=UPI001FF431AA|nr:cell wall hydrolase [Erythrobacter sp. F6033]MCK0128044.1 cell wall hydrolase [Erythrobacter sp. F6033]
MNSIRSLAQRTFARSTPEVIRLPDASRVEAVETKRPVIYGRIALLLAILAVPAMAAPGDFGAIAGSAPLESESVRSDLAELPVMPFERPGMSFPGSAFFYLADPPSEALVALPTTDALDTGAEDGRELGQMIDAGPAANPFFASVSGNSLGRAQQCLAQAIWYEAASESVAGQRAVAQVVLNRVAHRSWPGSVCGVVYQGSKRSTGCQFSFTCDGSLSRRAKGASWQRAQSLASDALAGSVYAPIGHATHYHTLWVNPKWASSLDHVGTIGAHRFYRNRGANGEKSAFNSGYSGFEPGVSSRTEPAVSVAPIAASAQNRAASSNAPIASSRPANRASASLEPLPVQPEQATPAYGGTGQVKEEYARAGQWKKRPAPADSSSADAAAEPASETP